MNGDATLSFVVEKKRGVPQKYQNYEWQGKTKEGKKNTLSLRQDRISPVERRGSGCSHVEGVEPFGGTW